MTEIFVMMYILSSTCNCTLDFQIPFVSFLFVVTMLTFLLLIILFVMYQGTSCLYQLQNLSILLFLSRTLLSRPPPCRFIQFYALIILPLTTYSALFLNLCPHKCLLSCVTTASSFYVCLCTVTLTKTLYILYFLTATSK